MKKAFLVILLVAVMVLPLTAASSFSLTKASKGAFGVGLNLGTNLGAAVKFDNSDWDLYGNVGFGALSKGVAIEAGAELKVTEFKIDKANFLVNAGLMIPVAVGNNLLTVGALGTGSIVYEFKDVPLHAYLRVGAGVNIVILPAFKVAFGYSGAIGATWMFE